VFSQSDVLNGLAEILYCQSTACRMPSSTSASNHCPWRTVTMPSTALSRPAARGWCRRKNLATLSAFLAGNCPMRRASPTPMTVPTTSSCRGYPYPRPFLSRWSRPSEAKAHNRVIEALDTPARTGCLRDAFGRGPAEALRAERGVAACSRSSLPAVAPRWFGAAIAPAAFPLRRPSP
jgi:hypothetical protein